MLYELVEDVYVPSIDVFVCNYPEVDRFMFKAMINELVDLCRAQGIDEDFLGIDQYRLEEGLSSDYEEGEKRA